MIVSIHQPAYLPWLGYYHRIAVSDVHIVLDHVQFEKNSFVNRNRIRTAQGSCWMTVPVRTRGRFGRLPIRELEIDRTVAWRRKHWETIRQHYACAAHFADHAEFFEAVYQRDWDLLIDLCAEINRYVLGVLAIDTRLQYSSSMQPHARKSELVLELCRAARATEYLSGPLGRQYLREDDFHREGIAVRYQDYDHPRYGQCRGDGFLANMSVVDLLFNHGPASRDILLGRAATACDEAVAT